MRLMKNQYVKNLVIHKETRLKYRQTYLPPQQAEINWIGGFIAILQLCFDFH